MVPIEVGLNIAALDLPKAQRGLNHIRVNVDNTMEPAAATTKVTMSGEFLKIFIKFFKLFLLYLFF